MIIILAGNIATGKTTIARRIMALAPEFHLVGIDEYRAEGRSEETSRRLLLEAFGQHEHIIYETTTANKTHDAITAYLADSKQPVVRVRIQASRAACLWRHSKRKDKAHFEWGNLTIDQSMDHIALCLRSFHSDQFHDTENQQTFDIARAILDQAAIRYDAALDRFTP